MPKPHTLKITQGPHGVALKFGAADTFLWQAKAAAVRKYFPTALKCSRDHFEPRFTTCASPSISRVAFEELLHRIIFRWLNFYAINNKPIELHHSDLKHPYSDWEIRWIAEREFGGRTPDANRVAAHLMGIDPETYRFRTDQYDAYSNAW